MSPAKKLKLEPPRKSPTGSYGPRLKKASNTIKFRGSDWLKERIEEEAGRWGMSTSNYLQAAMTTFIREGHSPKLYPEK